MDRSAQLEELDSLKSIFYSEEFQVTDNANEGGKTEAIFWAFCELGDNYVVKYLENLDSPEPAYLKVKYLPPIELRLTLPLDYPSKSPPDFVISCQWLHKSKINLLCKKLDDIWSEFGSVEILYAWCDFLKNESLSFLGCENELDITDLCSKHLSYVHKVQQMEEAKKHWIEEKVAFRENLSGNIKENSVNGVEPSGENNYAPDSSKSLRVTSSKVYKDNRYQHRNMYSYFRRPNRDKKYAVKKVMYKNRYDKRAILNLHLKTSPIKLLENYNTEREKVEFLRNFFTCNICFCDKLGKDCTKFVNCNHVFCVNCIRSYFTIKIKDGSVQSIKCPEGKCTTEALPSQIKDIVSEELFAKYDSVLLSKTLDTLGDIIYCPRQICQYPVSWDPDEKMASCPNCQYVFCVSCKMVYHGIEPCQYKPGEAQKLAEKYENGSNEERLQLESRYGKKNLETLVNNTKSEAWIKNNSKTCPNCNAAIEKSQGCNKMVCWKCNSPFCWLCGTILDPADPYFHYRDPHSNCSNKLFYLVHNLEEDEEDWDWVDEYEDELSDMDFDGEDDDEDDDDYDDLYYM